MKHNTSRGKRIYSPTERQREILQQLVRVRNNDCGHAFYICLSVGDYHLEHELPCPVCKPDHRYSDDDIFRMVISLSPEDEPDRTPLLACGSCHDALCPGCVQG